MSTTSTIPAVCEALVAKLAAAIPTAQVEWARPQDTLIQNRRLVYIGDVDGDSRIANAKAGRKERDESYTVDVLFVAMPPRGTRAQAALDVLEMYEALENLVADDPSLGDLAGVWQVTVDGYSLRPTPTTEAAAAVLATTVSVRARLT